MSARVHKPIYNKDNFMMIPGFVMYDNRTPFVRNVEKVKRVLFGEPIDHEETRKFLQEELAKQSIVDMYKWEFDFVKGKPMSPDGTERRFEWVRVNDAAARAACFAASKRRGCDEPDDELISSLYCDVANTAKPTPVSPLGERNESPNTENKRQSRITDYMPARKRSSDSAFAKKPSNGPRPSKISRSNDVAS